MGMVTGVVGTTIVLGPPVASVVTVAGEALAAESFSLAARSSLLGVCFVILAGAEVGVSGGKRISRLTGLALINSGWAGWAVVSQVSISG